MKLATEVDVRDTCPAENDRRAIPAVGAAVCACGYPLLPIGTPVRYRGEVGRVAAWGRQSHHTVAVTLPGHEYAIVPRDALTPMESA